MTSPNHTPDDPDDPIPDSQINHDSGSDAEPPTNTDSDIDDPASNVDADDETREETNNADDGKLTAAKRKAMRYGVESQNAAEDHPKLARFTMAFVVAVIASTVLVNPVAAQCDEGAGLFIADMQEEVGSMVLGFLVLMVLIALALILLPVAGTAAVGWTIIFAVGGALVLYMLAFWLFGQIGDYGVLGMDDACTPFY
jgi:hypothetical protein